MSTTRLSKDAEAQKYVMCMGDGKFCEVLGTWEVSRRCMSHYKVGLIHCKQ